MIRRALWWGDGGRSISMRLALTLWYSLWAFALVAAASGLVYGGLATVLDESQDALILRDTLRSVLLLLDRDVEEISAQLPKGDVQVHVRVLDAEGRILLESPGMSSDLAPPAPAELAGRAGAIRTHHQESTSGKQLEVLTTRVSSAADPSAVRYVQAAMDRTADRQLAELRQHAWVLLSLSLVACGGIGYWLARSSVRPIERMGSAMDRIHSNRLHERIQVDHLPRELAGLGRTFNGMLDRLEESFESVSQFSDNVAHELRTPINNLQNELEIALSRPRSDTEYRDVIGSCLEECGRLTHVVRSLLFLARADKESGALRRAELEISSELREVRDFYEGLAAARGIEIDVDAAGRLRFDLDRTLFRQAIGNLLSNAIDHTPAGGRIRLVAHEEEDALRVAVEDTGCGIPTEHLPHVFERFYRVEAARPDSRRNAGLGLSLVESIAARHGGCARIQSELGAGTRVTLTFPRSIPDGSVPDGALAARALA